MTFYPLVLSLIFKRNKMLLAFYHVREKSTMSETSLYSVKKATGFKQGTII